MKTLLLPDKYIITAIGDGKLPALGAVCRPSLFALPVKLGEKELVFNTFTRQLIEPGELKSLFTAQKSFVYNADDARIDELIKARFIVNNDTDEAALLSSGLKIIHLLGKKDSKKHGAFVILPTTACNARCFYCYEAGIEYKTMDDATADETVKYILATKMPGKIGIRWFGGEPLVASSVIDRIVDGLNANGVEFSSSIITNASLMTRETAKKAVEDWQVKSAQITLDGRRQEYLKRKAYVDASRDHYAAALDAALTLNELGVSVSIRLNADEGNIDDLMLLADELKTVFEGCKRIKVYVVDMYLPCGKKYSHEDNVLFYSRLEALQNKLNDLELCRSDDLPRLRTHRCMADMPNGASVIAPDGSLYSCEHMIEASRIGSLYDYESESDLRRSFVEDNTRAQNRPDCLTCVYLPECTLSDHCPISVRDCKMNVHLNILRKLLHFSG